MQWAKKEEESKEFRDTPTVILKRLNLPASVLPHRETALGRPCWSSADRAHSQEVRTFRKLVNSSLQASPPHEPPGPLDASLRGEVNKGVAVSGQLVWAGQRTELFPPAQIYSDWTLSSPGSSMLEQLCLFTFTNHSITIRTTPLFTSVCQNVLSV